jgi:hypothetical protein
VKTSSAHVLAFGIIALAGAPAAGQEAVGMKLEDAGFIMRQANTAEKMARLRQLPAHQFVTRGKGSERYFIYADPTYCKCAFVGTPAAMQAYRNMVAPPPTNLPGVAAGPQGNLTDELMARDIDADLGPVPEGDFLHFRF